MDESSLQLISGIGAKLEQLTRPSKDVIVKSLRKVVSVLSQIEQPSVVEVATKALVVGKLEDVTKPLRKSIVKHGLSNHTDKDVRLLVAICVSEFFRILAPQPPFADKYLRDMFKLILSMFMELADTTSAFFSRRVKILETVAQCKCCVIMLDIDCSDLILEMFNIFFSVVREHHQQSLINDILSIMTHILNEEVSHQLTDVILRNLVQESKGATSAASQLAASVIQSCAEKLQPFVCGFLTSCSLDRDAVGSELKEFYHEIVLKLFQCAPEMLNAIIPNLTQELMTDQVDVRIKAVNLIGKLLLRPEYRLAQRYHALFVEFLKRLCDKSSEVRVTALQCAKACYLANPSGIESHELLTAIEDRLLDFDDKVRMQAVIVACELAGSNLKYISSKLISEVIERLRDKKISVRKKALQKVMEVYRDYCNKCAEGHITMCDHFEQIPCKVLMLCYDKDCKEFRSQNIELVVAEELFPVLLPVEERARHWIHLFSLFSPLHVKALSAILSQKRRLQTEMRNYLAIRKEKENSSEDMKKKLKSSFVKMSASFPDPSKAEECFDKLSQMKDNNIFTSLGLLLDEVTLKNALVIRDKFLKVIGDKHPHFEFLQLLSSKCSFNIFDSEHVCCILSLISTSGLGSNNLEAFSIELLLVIISNFPSLMRGSELQFRLLFEEKYLIHDKIIQVLAKVGSHISVNFSDFYPVLKKICLEGTRTQSKYAVSAIASLIDVPKQYVFTELCEELVDSLHSGQNIATVLQSLGCIAQYSVSTFEDLDQEITQHVYKNIFQAKSLDDLSVTEDSSGCTVTCKLKIYGLKMLVKSFLPHRGSQVNRQINPLLGILLKMLQKGDMFDNIFSCASDKAYIRLAAAKSVLQLSRRWDLHISPDIFRFTILMAKDSSSFVRRLFLDKTHKLLKEHVIPIRYACAFTLATSDSLKDLQHDSFKYMVEFIKEYSREARIRQTSMSQGGSIMDFPAYIVVFLIHLLVHDAGFPSEDCQDEAMYAQFCGPLLSFLNASMNSSVVDGDLDLVNNAALYLNYIFRAIKRAKDAVDAQRTPRLHFLADIGISAVNSLHRNGISSVCTLGTILLPSSLYKITPMESEEANLKFLTQSFVERVVHVFKSQVSLPVGSVHKRGRKCHEDGTLNMVLGKQVDFSTCGALETHKRSTRMETSSGRRRGHVVPPNALVSIGSHNKGFTEELEYGASNSSEAALEKRQPFSSSGSVTQKPSQMESQVSTQKFERSNALKGNIGAGKIINAEASNSRKVKFNIASKELPSANEVLIGQRIKVWSTFDSCFHSGTVDDFNPENNTHKITCDNGEVEILCLDSESWETISDCSLTEREVVPSDKANTLHLRQCGKDTLDKFRGDANQQSKTKLNMEDRKFRSRKVPLSEKRKKGQILSRDLSSVSEIINIDEDAVAKRTRRRKL
ncbi:PREDICTED: sister chromatid cohesion protein PDS5 homolog A isoform X2 [Theobroma cacao]|uniref:Sister chromatid cohesion protein PDS5 homolog A isoform X2 n=1 Tax=Theobroma cacao TaxID=3641 RepID=A0AB32WRL6_THECC|nr:PREDICTED: sister chromatid cohesion protein PDS5 homolog A isoform X2 [Theobroma cacao]